MFVEQIFKIQRLEVSCAVRRIYTSLGAKGLIMWYNVKSSNISKKKKAMFNTWTGVISQNHRSLPTPSRGKPKKISKFTVL